MAGDADGIGDHERSPRQEHRQLCGPEGKVGPAEKGQEEE